MYCGQIPLDSQDPHSYITTEKAMHYQFNPFEKSASGGVEGTEVKTPYKKWRRKCIRKY
jgi:hypothetical protein